jgi:hypothetical protein
MQLSVELLEAFARHVDDGSFLPAGVSRTAFAPHAQTSTEVCLGELLGFEIRQEQLERFHPCGGVANGIREVLLIPFDLEFCDLGDRYIGAEVPHETVDFTCGELALTGAELE